LSILSIPGDVDPNRGFGETIETYSVCFEVFSPTDLSGNVDGPITVGPVTISKIIDRATVPLYDALIQGTDLGVIVIDFIRPATSGEEENYYRVTLEGAKVISIAEVTPKSIRFLAGNPHDALEEVSFVFTKIILEDLKNGITSEITTTPTKG